MTFESTIKNIVSRTPSIKSFQIPRPEGFDFQAGQFMRVTIKVNGEDQTKTLSISSSPTEKEYIECTKRITDSDFSQTLDQLQAGEWVKINGPMGRFTLDRAESKMAFLSGGIGITPIRSICGFCADQQLDRDVVLLFGNRSTAEIPFKDELEEMHAKDPLFRVVHTLDQAEEGWSGRVGFIDSDMVKEEIPDYAERTFFVCGPPKMVEVMAQILTEDLNLPEVQVVKEKFPGY